MTILLSVLAPSFGQASIRVEWKAMRLSVVAEKAPLAQILEEVARQTGIELKEFQQLQKLIDVHFSDLPVGQGLQALLVGVDYAILGNTSTPEGVRKAQLVVFSPLEAMPKDTTPVTAVRGPVRPAVSPAQASPNQDALVKAILGSDPAKQVEAYNTLRTQDAQKATQALLEAVTNSEGAARLQALELLTQDSSADSDTVLSALRALLNDEDSDVRSSAIQALGERRGADAMDLLRQAFSDPDPSVRLMVIESIGERPEGRALLQQALSDPNPSVRTSASSLLQAMSGGRAGSNPSAPQ